MERKHFIRHYAKIIARYLWGLVRITRLDRYLLKQYFVTVFFAIFVFILIAIPIDYSERSGTFADNPSLTAYTIITEYFLPFIPTMMALLANIIVFISVIFFTSKMAARSEFIAIFASGISLKRILRAYFIGGLTLALIVLWASDSALPKVNGIKADFQLKYIDRVQEAYTRYHYYAIIDSQTLLGINQYDAGAKRGDGVVIEKFNNGVVSHITRANSIEWFSGDKTWRLSDVTERKISHLKESIARRKYKDLHIFIKPEDFKQDFYLKDRLSNKDLKNKIRLEKIKGSEQIMFFEVEFYQRFARPFSILILSLIGGILASRKVRGGSGLNIAIGIVLAAMYIIAERFSTVLCTNASLNPIIASWLPNVLFFAIALRLYHKAPK